MLSVVLWPLGSVPILVTLVAWVYAFTFGILETLGLPIQAPGLAWQVPAQWIRGRSATMQTLTWGACLGPGLVTRNPYAGMWLLPLLTVLDHNLLTAIFIGMAIGVAHGGARAIGVLSNRRHLKVSCNHLVILGVQWRWQFMDGLAFASEGGIHEQH